MAKYIKGKDGKFKGSIGDGKKRVPTAAQNPVGLTKAIVDVSNTQEKAFKAGINPIYPGYDPLTEANNMIFAMGKGGSFSERRARKQARKALEARFGAIDWSDSQPVTIEDEVEDFFPEIPAPVTKTPEQAREEAKKTRPSATDKYLLEALDGRTGTLWLRNSEGDFTLAARNVRMLFEKPGSYSVAKDSEWYTKEHVLIQYGTYAQRYDIDDVSFAATDR